MTENVCCPKLRTVKCSGTKEHRHLFCDPQYAVEHLIIDNDWVKVFCIGEFSDCKYYPKNG